MRFRLARIEGAAKRLLDVLGWSADSRQGPEATVEALRSAADAVGKAVSGKGVRGCRGIEVEHAGQQTADGAGKRWEF